MLARIRAGDVCVGGTLVLERNSDDAHPDQAVIERLSKIVTIAAVALAIVLHLVVDPAGGWDIRVLAIVMFGAALACAPRWPRATAAAVLAILPLAPAILTRLVQVAALNLFYTVLLAALLGAMLPHIRRDRWSLPPWWGLLLGTWALTIAVGWPIVIAREAGPQFAHLLDVGALDTWAMLSTPQVESWILSVAIAQLTAVLWLDWLFSSSRNADSDGLQPVLGLLVGATIASIVAIYQGTVDIAFLSGGIWPDLRRAAGTLLDANAFGTIAAFAGPLAFVAIPALHLRHSRTLQAAALAVNWGGAWMSGSRTAFVCGALGTLLLVYALVRTRTRDTEANHHTSSLLAGAAAMVLVLIGVAGAVGPFRRFVADNAAAADLWSRGGYGTVATQMIRDYPAVGVGIGSFNWMASDYWRVIAHDRLPFDNAQNWWRHQIAELGIVGSLPIVLWSVLIAWLVLTRRSPVRNRVEAATLRGLLVGLGIASLLGVPTQNPIVLLMFFYLAARFEILTNPLPGTGSPIPDPRSPMAPGSIASSLWPAALLIPVVYAGGQAVLARGPLQPVARAESTSRDYVVGTYPGEPSAEGTFRWTRKQATFALNAPSKYLVIRVHIEHPDADMRPVQVRLGTSCQTLLDLSVSDATVQTRAVELPDGEHRVVFSSEVSRTWRPSDFGSDDPRTLGLAVKTDFIATPAVVSSQEQWIPLKSCS
jgi:hypothetical protein